MPQPPEKSMSNGLKIPVRINKDGKGIANVMDILKALDSIEDEELKKYYTKAIFIQKFKS